MKKKVVAVGLCLGMSAMMLACGSTVETSVDLSDASAEELQERIKELEKENAELKQNIAVEEQDNEDNPENWSDDMVIPFTDPSMLKYVRDITGIQGREITYADVKYITKFGYSSFSDITPIKYFTSLVHLEISTEDNTNLDMLKNLTNLEELSISGEHLTDISAVSNLTNLKYLYLFESLGCGYTDISAVSNLTNLEYLYIEGGGYDISVLINSNISSIDLWYTDLTEDDPAVQALKDAGIRVQVYTTK